MNILLRIIVSAIAIAIAAYIVPGIGIDSFWTAIVVAVVLAVVNGFIGWFLRLITFPINILSLWLVSFIITVLMVMLVSKIVPGFVVTGFWPALIFALVLALINMIFGVEEFTKV